MMLCIRFRRNSIAAKTFLVSKFGDLADKRCEGGKYEEGKEEEKKNITNSKPI